MPRKYVVFILFCEQTRLAILLNQKLDFLEWRAIYFTQHMRKTMQFQGIFVWIVIFYFENIFLTICIS